MLRRLVRPTIIRLQRSYSTYREYEALKTFKLDQVPATYLICHQDLRKIKDDLLAEVNSIDNQQLKVLKQNQIQKSYQTLVPYFKEAHELQEVVAKESTKVRRIVIGSLVTMLIIMYVCTEKHVGPEFN